MAENMNPNEFRQNRKALGFTQKALAYELGTHQRNICQFESGIIIAISKKIINAFKLLITDSSFVKALRNIRPILIDKNMFGVTYEDI